MVYNITNITQSGVAPNVFNFLRYANEVSTNWFGVIFVLVVFTVPFVGMLNSFSASRAFAASSFITVLISLALRFADVIGDFVLTITIFMAAGSLLWLMADR